MNVRNKLFLTVVAAVLLLGGLTIYWWYQEEKDVRPLGPSEEAYVLIMGLDNFGENERSDTIMVAKLEETGIKLLSIPRDLRVTFPDGSTHKINAAYARGIEFTLRLVSDLLGVPLHWYVVVDYRGFVKLIDAVGGVTVMIDEPMRYEDAKQNLVIDLPAGTQTLTGEEALDYWRYRDAATGEDLGRIRRQQAFLRALAERLAQDPSASRIQALVETAWENVRTNIAFVDAYRLAQRYRTLAPDGLQARVLPGRPELIQEGEMRVSYFIHDRVETAALVEEFFKGREVLTNRDVKMIVLNGHPDENVRPGLARQVSALLDDQGFQIVAYWNADAFDYPQSYLVNVSGNEAKAQRVANTFKEIPLSVVSPEAFSQLTRERFGSDRLQEIRKLLLTTAVEPEKRGVELTEADLVLILGGGFTLETRGAGSD